MPACELCEKTAEETRYNLLLDVRDQDIAEWTFNIISLESAQKLCTSCCQNVSMVGELLYQWRDKVRVSMEACCETKKPHDSKISHFSTRKLDTMFKSDEPQVASRQQESQIIYTEFPPNDGYVRDPGSEDDVDMNEDVKPYETDLNVSMAEYEEIDKTDELRTIHTTEPPKRGRGRPPGRPRKSEAVDKVTLKEKHKPSPKSKAVASRPVFICEVCSRGFVAKKSFENHKKSHENEHEDKVTKESEEPKCRQSFVRLSHHMQISHGIEPKERRPGGKEFLCRFCPKIVSKYHNLLEHERIHTKEKPLACEVCGKRFRRKQAYNQHISLHTGEKKYKCQFCDMRFQRSGNRMAHERIIHKTVLFSCPNGCNKQFAYPGQLSKHIDQTGCGRVAS